MHQFDKSPAERVQLPLQMTDEYVSAWLEFLDNLPPTAGALCMLHLLGGAIKDSPAPVGYKTSDFASMP